MEKCALELPRERLELDRVIFLSAPATFFPNLPMAKQHDVKQTREQGYVSENKMNALRACLVDLSLKISAEFPCTKAFVENFCKSGGANLRESENMKLTSELSYL